MKLYTPAELQQAMQQGRITVLDVRQPEEWAICHIAGSTHIPMGEVASRIDELNPAQPLVAVCHHGMRSEHVARGLIRAGFEQVGNLVGGIDAWAEQLDPEMARY